MIVRRRTNFAWGALALAAGGFALANALGYVPPGYVDIAMRALPALLVVAGLSFLLRDRLPFGGMIALVAGGALVAVIAGAAYSARVDEVRTDNQILIDQPVEAEIGLLRLRIEALATDVELIRALNDQRRVSGEFLGSTASGLAVDYLPEAGAATLTIREIGTDGLPPLDAVGRGALRLELPPDLALDVDFVGDSGAVTMNMSGLALERLNVSVAVGNVVVTLPDYTPQLSGRGEPLGTLTATSGDLTVFVPPAIAGRFELERAGSPIPPEFDENIYLFLVGDVLEARGYETALSVVRYTLAVPRGRIRIQVPG